MNKFLLFIWTIAFCRRQLLLTSWWQIKEYRLDRFWVFLKTKEEQRKTEIFLLLTKLLLLAADIFFKPLSGLWWKEVSSQRGFLRGRRGRMFRVVGVEWSRQDDLLRNADWKNFTWSRIGLYRWMQVIWYFSFFI